MSAVIAGIKGRNGSLAALVLAILLTLAIVVAIATAVLRTAQSGTNEMLRQLALYHAEVRARPQVESRLKEALRQVSTEPGLMQTSSAALAQAQLQSAVKSIAGNNGADVRSADILPMTRQGSFEVIAIQYDLSVPMSHLRDLAYAIETHTPYLFIDHATITASQNWQSDSAAARDPALEVRWTIRGYRWAGKVSP